MDAQTQDAMCVSEEQQLTAPPGWAKKLVPASAKSITLRKYDVVFIAPDGQEVKSKWHLTRYLKTHPEGPALSEFIWSSGEEAPVRRSTRFATKEASEDNKTTSRKKGKRDASEMEEKEIEHDQEKTPSRKRAKKAGKSAGLDEKSAVKDAAIVSETDEVMHEAIACDSETTQAAAPCDEVQKDESKNENLVEVEASNEAVTEKDTDEGLDKQVVAEKATGSNATIGGEHEDILVKDEGLDKQVEAEEAIVSSATIGGEHEDILVKDEELDKQVEAEEAIVSSAIVGGEHEEIQVKVVQVKESFTDNGLHAENECKAAQESDTLVAPVREYKIEEAAMETKVMELKEHLDQKFEENEDVSCKITVMTSVVEDLAEGNDKPLELSVQKDVSLEPVMQKDRVEPLMQKEEQERLTHIQNSPLEVEHIKDKSASEFSSSPVSVTVANQ